MTSQVVVAPPRGIAAPAFVESVRRRIETDALAIAVIAAWTSLLALSMPKLVVQDTWLAFVDGRLIAHSGLPHVDTLTYWSLGRTWTDQQWGAHLALYELARLGGLRAALVAGIACVTAALLVALVVTRKLGASPRSAAIGMLLPLVGAPWLTQVRTQSLALLPFVLLYGLLALDARSPGRRVLLVLPLLGVWANLHGSVALAAGLTALYGLMLLRSSGRRRVGTALALGAPVCVLASPYGFALFAYYRLMLLHPPLADFVREWKPADVEAATALFFISAFGITALLARHHRSVTPFERWALALLLVGALAAVRNAVWFELAAAVSFPRLLDAAWPVGVAPTLAVRRVNLVLGTAAIAVTGVLFGSQLLRPAGWLDHGRPPAAAAAVAAAAGPNGIVLADDEHADWLLWEQPSLEGRVAYDVRFELFSRPQLVQIGRLRLASASAWQRCGRTASVVTFAGSYELGRFQEEGVLAHGSRALVRTREFAAVEQPAPGAPCRL